MLSKWITGVAAFSLLLGLSAIVQAEESTDQPQSKELFKQLDKNSDGKVTKDEVEGKQAKFFDRLVRVGDGNKDGALSKDEFTQALDSKERSVEVEGSKGRGKGKKRDFNPEEFFKRLDRNSDGKVTKEELPDKLKERLAPLFEKLGKDEITKEEFADIAKKFRGKKGDQKKGNKKDAKPLFEKFDKNKDGQLTLEELPEKLQKRLKPIFEKFDKEALTMEDFAKLQGKRNKKDGKGKKGADFAKRFFEKLDKNGDGKIEKSEVPERFAKRFDGMDANGDGSVDAEEMKASMGKKRGKGKPKDGKGKKRKKGKRPEKKDVKEE